MPDTRTLAERLRLGDLLRGSAMRAAIGSLQLPSGSRGLDAGCGMGSHTLGLAEAVGPHGHVTGLDLSTDLLAIARESAGRSPVAGRVSFREGDVAALPFAAGEFDWVWSVDCVGFIPGDPARQIRELARVVKPGGVVAILLWSSQKLLPGHPLLEARLNATAAGLAPSKKDGDPRSHFLRALGWLHEAGLKETSARTFVSDGHAPLDEEHRAAWASIIEMRWGEPDAELTNGERLEFQRLRDRKSPDSIVDRPDYYAFFTYSMFRGKSP
jgi:demethylmenaquinone methyltransferase/2-methoxy-6-polyprenyl-1,4-benzoquinol methylase